MRALTAASGAALLILTAAAPARADEPPGDGDGDGDGAEPRLIPTSSDPGADPSTSPPPLRIGHHRQIGVAAQLISGARFIKTYDNTTYCGDRGDSSGTGNSSYCFGRVPTTLDLAVSYGLRPRLELLFELRLGLERDFGATATTGDGPRLRHYAPGVRFYFNPDEKLKFFSTAQLSIDATGYKEPSGDSLGTDIVLRNANGLFFDFHDAYGAYVFFGEELAVKRWLGFGLEFGLGIQGRYP